MISDMNKEQDLRLKNYYFLRLMRRRLLSYVGVIGFHPDDDDDLLIPQRISNRPHGLRQEELEDRDAEMKMRMIKMK